MRQRSKQCCNDREGVAGSRLPLLSRRSTARAADGESAAQLGVGEAARVLELTDAVDDLGKGGGGLGGDAR